MCSWLIGNSPECDINFGKAFVSYGPMFQLVRGKEAVFIKDLSQDVLRMQTLLKLQTKVEHPLSNGQLLNFGNGVVYIVEEIATKVKLKFHSELQVSSGEYEQAQILES
mmetsp:Transcript_36333/g.35224  ORF Transcript_36333/g.35224 Transcript_36333/m.35224 type:complete len:109 (-) Transcript_36333:270-596(-)